jgi:hypothetical protein
MRPSPRTIACLLAGGWLALAAGCLQIDTTVSFHEDGSSTITERLNFSRTLLDMASQQDAKLQIETLLTREAALTRMQQMGKGMTLVSHKIQDGRNGSREAIAVFKIPDLNDFTYVSPWLAYLDYGENNAIKWSATPMYKSRPYGGRGTGAAGSIAIGFQHVKKQPQGAARETPDKVITPVQAQVFRELGPMFRDVLQDFQLKLTFEAYAPLHYGPNPRGRSSRAKSVDIINITDKDLDRYGYGFFENEEIMLDLVQWDIGSSDVAEHLKDYGANQTLPAFTPFGSKHMWWIGYDGNAVYLPPSKQLFDRYFPGKKLDFAQWQASPPDKHVLADWNQVGYVPDPGEKGRTEQKAPAP